ncbi:hypothetical protein V8C42DRAFT_269177 [Trichoderma barbatum]
MFVSTAAVHHTALYQYVYRKNCLILIVLTHAIIPFVIQVAAVTPHTLSYNPDHFFAFIIYISSSVYVLRLGGGLTRQGRKQALTCLLSRYHVAATSRINSLSMVFIDAWLRLSTFNG